MVTLQLIDITEQLINVVLEVIQWMVDLPYSYEVVSKGSTF